jgi:hypothetical protein
LTMGHGELLILEECNPGIFGSPLSLKQIAGLWFILEACRQV